MYLKISSCFHEMRAAAQHTDSIISIYTGSDSSINKANSVDIFTDINCTICTVRFRLITTFPGKINTSSISLLLQNAFNQRMSGLLEQN